MTNNGTPRGECLRSVLREGVSLEYPRPAPSPTGDTSPSPARTALWHAIATTEGPLRLPWPTVQQWARADAAKAGYTGTTT